jgi:hypothetical protein
MKKFALVFVFGVALSSVASAALMSKVSGSGNSVLTSTGTGSSFTINFTNPIVGADCQDNFGNGCIDNPIFSGSTIDQSTDFTFDFSARENVLTALNPVQGFLTFTTNNAISLLQTQTVAGITVHIASWQGILTGPNTTVPGGSSVASMVLTWNNEPNAPYQYTVLLAPEPSSLGLMAAGLAGIIAAARRRRQ